MSTDFEQQLAGALERRASTAPVAPQSLDAVRHRARGIRRRRIAVSAAGVAAALAVIAPLGLSATGVLDGDPDRSRDIAVASPGPSPVPPPVTEPVTVTTGAAPGDAPGIAWLEADGTLHLPGGTMAQAEPGYRALSVVASRVLAFRSDPDTGLGTVDEIGTDGSVLASYGALMAPMTDDAGTVGAWVDRQGRIVWAGAGGQTTFDTEGNAQLLSVDADGAWFTPEGAERAASRIAPDGSVTGPLDVLGVNDSLGERVTATLTYDDMEPGSCGGVLRGGREEWRTCDFTVDRFSPDGAWVLATDAYLDGMGQGTLAILDAGTGGAQVQYEVEDGVFFDWRWEDAAHALAVVHTPADQAWQVVRLGLDGSVEQAVAPRRGTDLEPPFWLGS
ncbi:MAG: hypothetical protein LT071_02020 [Nocardioides sp.]|nr:hypothetical protein [Nocardioides sp.]